LPFFSTSNIVGFKRSRRFDVDAASECSLAKEEGIEVNDEEPNGLEAADKAACRKPCRSAPAEAVKDALSEAAVLHLRRRRRRCCFGPRDRRQRLAENLDGTAALRFTGPLTHG
jgi:hypothetical protein